MVWTSRTAKFSAVIAMTVCVACSPARPPSLVENLSANGGETMNCPYADTGWTPRHGSRRARSSELERRLQQLAPAGTAGARVEEILRANGFETFSVCPTNPNVRNAVYRDRRRFVAAIWELDQHARTAWITGYVVNTGVP